MLKLKAYSEICKEKPCTGCDLKSMMFMNKQICEYDEQTVHSVLKRYCEEESKEKVKIKGGE